MFVGAFLLAKGRSGYILKNGPHVYLIRPFDRTCRHERTLGFLRIICAADSQQSAPADFTECPRQAKNPTVQDTPPPSEKPGGI